MCAAILQAIATTHPEATESETRLATESEIVCETEKIESQSHISRANRDLRDRHHVRVHVFVVCLVQLAALAAEREEHHTDSKHRRKSLDRVMGRVQKCSQTNQHVEIDREMQKLHRKCTKIDWPGEGGKTTISTAVSGKNDKGENRMEKNKGRPWPSVRESLVSMSV